MTTHLLTDGDEKGEPVFIVHGNASASWFFEDTLAALPGDGAYRAWPDLRGFDGSENEAIGRHPGPRGLLRRSHDLVDFLKQHAGVTEVVP